MRLDSQMVWNVEYVHVGVELGVEECGQHDRPFRVRKSFNWNILQILTYYRGTYPDWIGACNPLALSDALGVHVKCVTDKRLFIAIFSICTIFRICPINIDSLSLINWNFQHHSGPFFTHHNTARQVQRQGYRINVLLIGKCHYQLQALND